MGALVVTESRHFKIGRYDSHPLILESLHLPDFPSLLEVSKELVKFAIFEISAEQIDPPPPCLFAYIFTQATTKINFDTSFEQQELELYHI